MAAVTSRSPLMSLQQSPSMSSECRPFTVSATFFQPRQSVDEKPDDDEHEEEEEEEEESNSDKKIIKMTIIHGGTEQSSVHRKSASPENTVTATLIRSRSTSVLVVHDQESERDQDEQRDDQDDECDQDDDQENDQEDDQENDQRNDQENDQEDDQAEEDEEVDVFDEEDKEDRSDKDDDEKESGNHEGNTGQKIPQVLIQGTDCSDEDGSSQGKEDEESTDENERKQSTEEDEDENTLSPGKRIVQRKVSRSEELEPAQLASKIAEYQRISTVGTGSFGRVILVQHRTGGYYALKMMGIREVIRNRQIEHVHSEKNILLSVDHPFIIKLHWAYHDTKFLYMLFDYVPGGELFSYLRCARRFCNYTARFYTAEIVLALEYLHNQHIVYRDLKPENILLDKDGHARLTDFGFAKMLTEGRTWTMCGTPEYLAPEIVTGKGHNTAVDWWSLGVLAYEMLTGRTPFPGKESNEVYDHILSTRPKFTRGFDPAAKDLIKRLLVVNRVKRLGNLKGSAADVKAHKWFVGVDWNAMYGKKVQPPIKPTVNGEGDTGNYDEYDEDDLSQISDGTADDLELFQDW